MAKMAQDTFVAQLDDGSDMLIVKGQILSDKHELVKRDANGAGSLFRTLDLGDDDPPVRAPGGKSKDDAPPPKAAGK
jgi:hypothetical protein